MTDLSARLRLRAIARFLALAGFALAVTACTQLQVFLAPGPGVPGEWTAFVGEIRDFERRIGFTPTENFLDFSKKRQAYAFCGHASRLVLPYSYEDPAIRWRDSATEKECRSLAAGGDVFFGKSEAVGESGTPVTPSMMKSRLDRFLYLVIHEDCHDQFELPYGVEEALCDVIAYRAMAQFAEERFGAHAPEDQAIRRYASVQSEQTRATIDHYEQLSVLYARYDRRELSEDVLMRERGTILARASRAIAWRHGALNNVGLANHMTYSRHYPFLESVLDAFGGDLVRTVAFFRQVDRIKPSRATVMKQRRLPDEESAEFIRAYEEAVIGTVRRALAETQRKPEPVRTRYPPG